MIYYSFIIPHHNNPELLNRCIESIPQREDTQIIVIDDNSKPDKRPNIPRNDVEIQNIDATDSKGAGHARNIGMTKATGKWLVFADCDDYFSNDFLQTLDRYRDSDNDVVYYNYQYIDSRTNAIITDCTLQSYLSHFDESKQMSDYIRYCNHTPWSKMVRRDFVESNGMYFEEVPNGNDTLFSLFVGLKCRKFAVAHERLYCYVKNENSIGTKRQSVENIMCKVTHIVKGNQLNKAIGHEEWNRSFIKRTHVLLYGQTLSRKIRMYFTLLLSSYYLFRNRKEWIDILGVTEKNHP